MSPAEIGIIILLSIWSVITVVLGILVVLILWQVKKALDKINHLLDSAEGVVEGVGRVGKLVTSSAVGLVSKGLSRSTKKVARLKSRK